MPATDVQSLLRDSDRFLADVRLNLERALLDERDVAGVIRGFDTKLTQLDRNFATLIRETDSLGNAMGGPQQSKFLSDTQAKLHDQYTRLCMQARASEANRGQVDGRFRQQYDKVVVQGLASVRDTDVKAQSRTGIKSALRSVVDKLLPGNQVPGQYKDQISDALAGEIVDQDDLDGAFIWAQQVLVTITGYVQQRVTFPATIRAIADSTDGASVPAPHLAGVQDGIQQQGAAARDLDQKVAQMLERSKTKVSSSFSVDPKVVLDPTVRFIKQIDASYNVTISKNEVSVKLNTGFTLERPFMNDAKLDLHAGIDVNVGSSTTLQLGYSSSLNSLYKGPQYTDQQVFIKLQIRF